MESYEPNTIISPLYAFIQLHIYLFDSVLADSSLVLFATFFILVLYFQQTLRNFGRYLIKTPVN